MSKNIKYLHTSRIHNMDAPRIIVEKVNGFIHPRSVVDFGCGLGTFLKAFKEHGVLDVLGLDGPWADRTLMSNYIRESEFQEADLENEIVLPKKYDLAISLEVAEHLSGKSADIFIQNLVNSSEVILFSAAIPFQGGQNHINEQFIEYWQEKFKKYDYYFIDNMRFKIWQELKVNWWYKQNMFLVVSKTAQQKMNIETTDHIYNLVHPDHYLEKCIAHQEFRLGKGRIKVYFKLFIKSIFYKLKWLKK